MAKSSRRRSDKVLIRPPVDSATTRPSIEMTDGDIALRAFELYCERGRQDGHDVDDWLQAARELRSKTTFTAA